MEMLAAPGGGLVVQYARPRPDLTGVVLPGTVLVRGHWRGPPPRVFVGEAFVFSRLCGAIPYPVRGTVDQSQVLMLFGGAPQFDTSCRIVGYDINSQQATLRFEPTKPPPAPVAPPVAQPPAAAPETTNVVPPVAQPPAVAPETTNVVPPVAQPPAVAPETTNVVPVTAQGAMPERQRQFVDIIDNFAARYGQTPNEMAQGALRPQRANAICSLMSRDTSVRAWIGKVKKMSSNNEGKGVLEISISPSASVKTWNNALSDIGDHTLLEPGSPLHTQAVDLRPGQSVEFSGTFLAGNKDCFGESSITQRGSMSEPEWLFRFQTITPKADSRG
jgi:hypothetical protein